MVGGLGTLIGPVLGAVAIQWLVTSIGSQQAFDANLVLGTILLLFVLLVPAGVVPMVERLIARLFRRGRIGRADIVAAATEETHVSAAAAPAIAGGDAA